MITDCVQMIASLSLEENREEAASDAVVIYYQIR